MLRKLIVFAITSGLAKKAWDHYRSRPATARAATPRSTADASAAYAQPVAPVSPMHYN